MIQLSENKLEVLESINILKLRICKKIMRLKSHMYFRKQNG